MPNEAAVQEIRAILEKAKSQTLSDNDVTRVLTLVEFAAGKGPESVQATPDPFAQVRTILAQTNLESAGTQPSTGAEDRIKEFAQKARRAAS